MKKRARGRFVFWWGKVLVVAIGIAVLASCGLVNTLRASFKQDEEEVDLNANKVIIGRAPVRDDVEPWANKFALMALFARVVYRHDLDPSVRRSQGCDYLQSGKEIAFGMPRQSDGGGWSRWKGASACYNEAGLYYETYAYAPAQGPIQEAVIAYRGTENWNMQDVWHDWRANLSALLGLDVSQYSHARRELALLVKGLQAENPKVQIYTTGHSLGGGLAQQAIYASKDIKRAYTFDPSPVTNWSQLRLGNELQQRDPEIYRIYHRREVLGYVRAITSRVNARRFGRSDYEFHFQDENAGEAHNMAILACHFAARIKQIEVPHNFTREAARELIRDENVCPADIQKQLPQ
jgi:hypothetical protein